MGMYGRGYGMGGMMGGWGNRGVFSAARVLGPRAQPTRSPPTPRAVVAHRLSHHCGASRRVLGAPMSSFLLARPCWLALLRPTVPCQDGVFCAMAMLTFDVVRKGWVGSWVGRVEGPPMMW